MHNPFKGFNAVENIAPGLSGKEDIFMYVYKRQ
jgi:hypothetical protein